MPLLTTGAGVYKAAAVAPASSVWGDHGTNVTLSTTVTANDTATGTAGSFSYVRGTQAHTTTGKYYFEIKILTAPAAPLFIMGIMDDTTANGADLDAGPPLVSSLGHSIFNGNRQANGYNGNDLGAGFGLSDNDVMGFAVDFDANGPDDGYYYLSLNNVYFLGGDPTSGTAGTGSAGGGGFAGARPMACLYGTFGCVVQLITNASALTYLPSGYSAWG